MPMREISKSVEDIESEAEKILEEARIKANKILLKGKEEAKGILSSQLPLDEVKTEFKEIVRNAEIEAYKQDNVATNKASEIITNADKKTDGVVKRIVSIVIGQN